MDCDMPVLARLLTTAFDHLAGMAPTVVRLAGEVSISDLPWPRVEVEDTSQMIQVVHERLAAGPVLVVPPWGRLADQRQGLREASRRALAADALLAELRPTGPGSLLGVVLPASTLTSERERPTREAIADMWQPAIVLYDTGAFPGMHTSFQLGVLFLVPRHHAPVSTVVFRVPNASDPALVEKDLRRLLRNGTGRGHYGYVIQSSLPPGESLQFERHDPAVLARRADLSGYGGTVNLGQMFEFPAPGIHRVRDHVLFCSEGEDGAVRVLSGRDIGRDGVVLPPGDSAQWARVPADRQLKAGDVIFPRIFRPSDRGGVIAAEVTVALCAARARPGAGPGGAYGGGLPQRDRGASGRVLGRQDPGLLGGARAAAGPRPTVAAVASDRPVPPGCGAG